MVDGERSPVAEKQYEQIWKNYYELTPHTDKEMAFYQESLTRLNGSASTGGSGCSRRATRSRPSSGSSSSRAQWQ